MDYDRKDRIKKIDGDWNEYWYDADGNRINMYYYHTNMKYAYDCSGGRHRLLWTSDHLEKDTTYAYGADGLLWSVCDGEYRFYHYDYRGSVVAVTDMDGNITDTVKYDAYGSVVERTGDSNLIFGYNGQYGVLTDPNGLLYMRTRFYNPDLKRFMNADILEGSIADSTSLNVFTYVNGNPISYVDPWGLSADRGNNENPFIHWSLEDQKSAFEAWDSSGRPSTSYRLVEFQYKIMVAEALRKTAASMKGYYSRNYRSLDQTNYYTFHDAIFKTIDSLYNLNPVQEFDMGVKIRIEIEENVNIAPLNIAGDLVGLAPILGEIYGLVDFMSEDNADLSKLGSVLASVITEKDIAKLTPYAAELDKLGDLSKIGALLSIIKNSSSWNSPENLRKKISIFVQKDQEASFMYQALVDSDSSFKVMFDAPTGTVIRPEDDMISIIYK